MGIKSALVAFSFLALSVLCSISYASGGVTLPSGIANYVPILLTNSQPAPYTYNSQIQVTFNALAFQSYEASNLQNAEFFYANGTLIPSWMEGNSFLTSGGSPQSTGSVSSSSSNVIFWLRIYPANTFLAASSNNDVYMGFASTSTNLLSSTVTGEAPELSGAYGEYDNGANVFSYYNIAPYSASGFTISGSAGVTSGAPAGSYFATTNAFYAVTGSNPYMYSSSPAFTPNTIITYWMYVPSGALEDFYFLANSGGDGQMARIDERCCSLDTGFYQTSGWTSWGGSSQLNTDPSAGTWDKVDLVIGAAAANMFYTSTTDTPIGALGSSNAGGSFSIENYGNYFGFQGDNSGTGTNYVDGLIVRQAPPDGVQASDQIAPPTISLSNTISPNIAGIVAGSASDGALVTASCAAGDTCQIDGSNGISLASGTTTAALPYSSLPIGYSTLYANDLGSGEVSGNVYVDRVTASNTLAVTLSNDQNSAYPNNAQIPISVNSLAYEPYEAPSLDNTFFYYANGTLIQSWLQGNTLDQAQSSNLYTSENILYWIRVDLGAAFLPAQSTNTVYLGFAPASDDLIDGNIIGEAPALSSTFGQYDNGNAWGVPQLERKRHSMD